MVTKKILILVGNISKKSTDLKSILSYNIPEANIDLHDFTELNFNVRQGNISVFVRETDLSSYDLVYIRSVSKSYSFLAGVLALYLEKNKIKFIDKKFLKSQSTSNKLTSVSMLALKGCPIIPTFYCPQTEIVKNSEKILALYGFPILAKDLFQHYLKGVYVLNSIKDFEKLTDANSEFIFQPLLKIKEEYRLLVLGDVVRVVHTRTPRRFDGSKVTYKYDDVWEKYLNINDIPEEIKKLAVKASNSLDLQVGGVDVLVTMEDKIFLIEVNGNPGFNYDTKVSPELLMLASYLKEQIK